jgi:hypothetical protein
MVDLFKSVFNDEMFLDVYYVDSNPAIVETFAVKKIDGKVITESSLKTYYLNNLSEDRQDFDLLCRFFVKMNFQWHPTYVKYFKGGIISWLKGRRNPERLVEFISDYDWAIVSSDVLAEISKLPGYMIESDCNVQLAHVGNIVGTQVYLIPEQLEKAHGYSRVIYTGKRRSITPVIHTGDRMYDFQVNVGPDIKKYILL